MIIYVRLICYRKSVTGLKRPLATLQIEDKTKKRCDFQDRISNDL